MTQGGAHLTITNYLACYSEIDDLSRGNQRIADVRLLAGQPRRLEP